MTYAELRPREVLEKTDMLTPYRGFLMSEKFDGWRGLWDGKSMHTKKGKKRFQLPSEWKRLLPAGQALDGEVYIHGMPATKVASLLNDSEHPLWQKATYRVFDIPSQGARPFRERVQRYGTEVKKACAKTTKKCPFQAVEQTAAGTPAAILRRYRQVLKKRGEGLVLTDPASKYVHGKVGKYTRVKFKGRNDKEAVVAGYRTGADGGLKSLEVHPPGQPKKRFYLGTGLKKVHKQKKTFRKLFPKGTLVKYSYEREFPSGLPRHARFVGIRHASE
jgi:DNA ligase 1